MKHILCLVLIAFITSCNNQSGDLIKKEASSAEVAIKLKFPDYFGKEFLFDAIIVDKPNTYFAQNFLLDRYFLKIISVNSIKLEEPFIMEPVNLGFKNYKIGQIVTLKGHEELYSSGQIKYLDNDFPIQHNFNYRSVIVISQLNQ